MNKHFLRSLLMTAALSAGLVGNAFADQLWTFSSLFSNSQQNTSLGSSYTFTQGGNWLQATAVVPMWTASSCTSTTTDPCLFAKDTTGDPTESGLGLSPANQSEINYPDGIALQAAAGNPIDSIELGSVQTGESWALDGCSAMFTNCTTIRGGVGGGSNESLWLTGLGQYSFTSYVVYVPCANGTTCGESTTSGGNNILLMSAVTSVPEPGVLALFGAGLLGCAIVLGRRRRGLQTRA